MIDDDDDVFSQEKDFQNDEVILTMMFLNWIGWSLGYFRGEFSG
jgi:hypothetical protein